MLILLHRGGLHGGVLRIVETYDQGLSSDFEAACAAAGVPATEVPVLYLDALAWAAKLAPAAVAPSVAAAAGRCGSPRQQAPQP